MDEQELYSHMRELIGNPSREEVPNLRLRDHLIASFDWMAGKLKYLVRTEARSVLLVADQVEYQLPGDLLWLIWAAWNNAKLEGASQYRWDRDGSDFRDAEGGTPDQYAIQGDELLLFPPPSSTAIATDSYLTLRYIATPISLEAGGPKGLFDTDHWLALYKAAIRYLRAHPTDENLARVSGYQEEMADLLHSALSRNANRNHSYEPGWRPYTERSGGAR